MRDIERSSGESNEGELLISEYESLRGDNELPVCFLGFG